MATRTPKASPVSGDSWVLQNSEGYGSGLGHIPTGSVVEVIDVHPAGTPGVGHAGEDSVLVKHLHDTHVITDEGDHAPGQAVRHFSLHTADFQRLFKKAGS